MTYQVSVIQTEILMSQVAAELLTLEENTYGLTNSEKMRYMENWYLSETLGIPLQKNIFNNMHQALLCYEGTYGVTRNCLNSILGKWRNKARKNLNLDKGYKFPDNQLWLDENTYLLIVEMLRFSVKDLRGLIEESLKKHKIDYRTGA